MRFTNYKNDVVFCNNSLDVCLYNDGVRTSR